MNDPIGTIDEQHGPDPTTWFSRGVWPTCVCGHAPRDNVKLNAHWRDHGFEVVDVHGQLTKRAIT